MPEVIETTVYKFEELDERAKERARDWYRESSDESDLEGTIEDFTRICDIIGITLATEPVKLMGGGTRYDPKLAYSVGFSQSDFAGYDGRYSYAKGAARRSGSMRLRTLPCTPSWTASKRSRSLTFTASRRR